MQKGVKGIKQGLSSAGSSLKGGGRVLYGVGMLACRFCRNWKSLFQDGVAGLPGLFSQGVLGSGCSDSCSKLNILGTDSSSCLFRMYLWS